MSTRPSRTDEDKKSLYVTLKPIYHGAKRIIQLLSVPLVGEEATVAHYLQPIFAEKILFPEPDKNKDKAISKILPSKMQMGNISAMNDSTEGKALFKYIGIEGSEQHDETNQYQAFINCFTFNHDHLTQFRLYGKQDNQEATGVSLVVKSNFFDTLRTICNTTKSNETNTDQVRQVEINNEYVINNNYLINKEYVKYQDKLNSINEYIKRVINKSDVKHYYKLNSKINYQDTEKTKNIFFILSSSAMEYDKYALYRCIYLDPETQEVISLGHRERYTFFREGKREKHAKRYAAFYERLLEAVKSEMGNLKKSIEELLENKSEEEKQRYTQCLHDVLLELRYLIKHVAFKEEQECRMLSVEPLNNNSKIHYEKGRMYIEAGYVQEYVTKIYFGPKAQNMALFRDRLKTHNLDIKCKRSTAPLA